MPAIELLSLEKLSDHFVAQLSGRFSVHYLDNLENLSALTEIGSRIQGIITRASLGVTPAIIDACPNLEIVSSRGVGTELLSLRHAAERGVIVANTPGVFDNDVANLGIALLFATSRNIVRNHQFVTDGKWTVDIRPAFSKSIGALHVGILGLGRIGKLVAERLQMFGCKISYYGRNKQPSQSYDYFSDLLTMAVEVDVLIVCAPGGSETNHIVNASVLDALGREGILINIGRGSVVDEKALVAALTEGRLGSAGLDVFEDEPNVPKELFSLDNVILQPHQGAWTRDSNRGVDDMALANLVAHFNGDIPSSAVAQQS